jgi:hypothetical protein
MHLNQLLTKLDFLKSTQQPKTTSILFSFIPQVSTAWILALYLQIVPNELRMGIASDNEAFKDAFLK